MDNFSYLKILILVNFFLLFSNFLHCQILHVGVLLLNQSANHWIISILDSNNLTGI